MLSVTKFRLLGTALAIGVASMSAASLAQDKETVLKDRQASPTGEYVAKPVIWTDWNKFLEAQKAAASKADTLLVAVNGGDKTAIETAFNDLGKNGCGGCHTTFREKIEK